MKPNRKVCVIHTKACHSGLEAELNEAITAEYAEGWTLRYCKELWNGSAYLLIFSGPGNKHKGDDE